MSEKYRIGVLRGLLYQPMNEFLQRSPEISGELLFGAASAHIEGLLSKTLDAAFVNPIDYAQHSSDLFIYPLAPLSSEAMSGVLRIYFREELKRISTLAIHVTSASEVVLARIVLGEKYDTAPAIVPIAGNLDMMLQKADAALLIDEQVFTETSHHSYIDLVDDWTDITDLPYVHALCVGRNEGHIEGIQTALTALEKNVGLSRAPLAKTLSEINSHFENQYAEYFSHFSYQFSDQILQSLEEYYRLAFYHGMLSDIPEINLSK